MPELPDLTIFANNLASKLKGKKVKSVEFYQVNRMNVTSDELRRTICDSRIIEINRSGKQIEFLFSNKTKLLVHLMLSGRFSIVNDITKINFKVFAISFFDGDALVISDPNGLVTLDVNPIPSNVPDALEINKDYLMRKINEKPKSGAKAFLTNPAVIRGIGNTYADEILWQAKISPKSLVGKLPDNVIDDLLNSINSVLLDAIEKIKSISPGIIAGEVRDFLAVHNPNRQESPTGGKIIVVQIASKTTYYTDEQVLYK